MSASIVAMRSAFTIISITVALIAGACGGGDAPTLTAAPATPTTASAPTVVDDGAAGDNDDGDNDAADDAEIANSETDDEQPADESTDPTAIAQPTAADPAITPTEAPPTATPMPRNDCRSGLIGDPSTTVTATADFDGDGAGDQVTAYDTGDPLDPWHIRVDTASGESFDSAMGLGVSTEADVRPIGGADVDGDGTTDELFVIIGAGASTVIVGIYNRVGCDIVQVMLDGSPLEFPIGGSIGNIGGLQCVESDEDGANNTLVAWNGFADFDSGEGTYLIEGFEYRLRGVVLDRIGSKSFTANTSQADFVYGQLSCGSVNL